MNFIRQTTICVPLVRFILVSLWLHVLLFSLSALPFAAAVDSQTFHTCCLTFSRARLVVRGCYTITLRSPVVTICTAQWSLYVPHSGHCMYRTVVTTCILQWSLYVQHSGHCMYRTVVTVCTVQWSMYVPHSGQCMYPTVVTICTAQWPLYVPHSGHYMYRTVVTICTASLTFSNSTFCPHSVFMCFVWI